MAADSRNPLAIRGVTVIDGVAPVRKDWTVLISGERITDEGSAIAIPPNATIIDGKGRYLIPGLWDMHVHLSWTKDGALPILLANGVTAVRDMGGILREIDEWRVARLKTGPRIWRAGPTVNGKAFNWHQIAVTNEAEARATVRALEKAGVDFIKVHAAMGREAYFAIASECKSLGLPFAGHLPRAIQPEEAIDAGQATFEHIETIFDGKQAVQVPEAQYPSAIRAYCEKDAGKLFDRMAKRGVAFCPTLSIYQAAIQIEARLRDPKQRYVSASSKAIMAELMKRPSYQTLRESATIQQEANVYRELAPLIPMLQSAGVPLLTGTDLASNLTFPGFDVHSELELMVQAGLTPVQALRAATCNPARLFRRDDLGRIEKGKLADVVLLDADPLADIRNTQKIRGVAFNGNWLDRAALDSMLGTNSSPQPL